MDSNKEAFDLIIYILEQMTEDKEKYDQEAKFETVVKEAIIEAIWKNKTIEEKEAYCTCDARVMCQYAFRSSEPVHIVKNRALVHIGSFGLLNQTDIELNRTFSGCMKASKEEKFKCSVDKKSIAGGTWQRVISKNGEGEEKKFVCEDSYMICTKYGGIIYFCNNGQTDLKIQIKASFEQRLDLILDEELYEKNETYRLTAQYIFQVTEIDEERFGDTLVKIKEVYNRNKERYEKISKENGYIPPELIAAIHYEENAQDFLNETFDVYLHNGNELGKKSEDAPKPDLREKGEFDIAAVDALVGKGNYFINRARNLKLTPESKDLIAMAAFAAVYNGWTNKGRKPYVYSGTNVYEKGLYTSDYHYDAEAISQNCGVYLILLALLNQE